MNLLQWQVIQHQDLMTVIQAQQQDQQALMEMFQIHLQNSAAASTPVPAPIIMSMPNPTAKLHYSQTNSTMTLLNPPSVTPVTYHPPHTHIRPISELIMSYRYDWMSAHGRLLAGWNGSSWQKPFDFQYMYISRRGDIVGPPVWKSTISPHLSKSELASLRLWQSECQ